MTNTQKRLLLWFAGLIPTLATFWLALWAWQEFRHHFDAPVYSFGWVVTVVTVVGIPCFILGVITVWCTAEDDDKQLDRNYNNLTSGLRRGRAMLSQRLAPPTEEEEEEA